MTLIIKLALLTYIKYIVPASFLRVHLICWATGAPVPIDIPDVNLAFNILAETIAYDYIPGSDINLIEGMEPYYYDELVVEDVLVPSAENILSSITPNSSPPSLYSSSIRSISRNFSETTSIFNVSSSSLLSRFSERFSYANSPTRTSAGVNHYCGHQCYRLAGACSAILSLWK